MARKRDIKGNRLYHFELSGGSRTVRWILIGVLLVIAAVALTVGLWKALDTPAGWQEVEGPSVGLSCSHEFTLMYEFGAGDRSATEERKALQVLYSEVCQTAWKLFYNEAGQTELNGLNALNQQPNTQIQVDKYLYAALELLNENGSRGLYLAPVYAAYDQVFYSDDETIALENDPATDAYTREYVAKLAAFSNDPKAVQLQLQGDNQVTLYVSQEYLSFAKDNEIATYLDFGWLRNAFVIDYMAKRLTESGFTNGYLTSVDGFVRNLDQRNTAYSYNLLDQGNVRGVMEYHGPSSIAFFRSYPVSNEDYGRYYAFTDGRILTSRIDPADGQSKAATPQLVSYSTKVGCAELALSVMPVYVTDGFKETAVNALTEKGIYSVWFSGNELRYNQKDLTVQTDTAYTAKYTKE